MGTKRREWNQTIFCLFSLGRGKIITKSKYDFISR